MDIVEFLYSFLFHFIGTMICTDGNIMMSSQTVSVIMQEDKSVAFWFKNNEKL